MTPTNCATTPPHTALAASPGPGRAAAARGKARHGGQMGRMGLSVFMGLMASMLLLSACSTAPKETAPEQWLQSNPTQAGVPKAQKAEPTAVPVPTPAERSATPSAGPNPQETASEGASEPALIDPLDPERLIQLRAADAQSDLWARLRGGFALEDLETDLVRRHEQFYATRPDYVRRMTERGGRYLYHILEEVERRGMPSELALLPFIESAFNPEALSVAKASGIWQFMSATGKDFDLKQNIFRDDRRDVLASTRAALDYLQKLHALFKDWHLALAAYNWGQGNLQRAIDHQRRRGLPTDYLGLRSRMPAETQNYVPKLQAVKNIVNAPGLFGLSLPDVRNHPYFLVVPIQRDIDVSLAAEFSGLSADDFRALNPQLNKPVILAAGTPRILLPYDNAAAFVEALNVYAGPLASWTAWVAPKTLKAAEVAKSVGMSESQLREVNRIPARMLVKAGSTLLVPRKAHALEDVPERIADHATMALAPESPALRRVQFKASKGSSVQSVAKRYRVSAQQVAQWNDVGPKSQFKPGQTVVVYLPHKAKAPARRSAASGAASSRAQPRKPTTVAQAAAQSKARR
jgi:membrane-bound lytic murein transglycosylase D